MINSWPQFSHWLSDIYEPAWGTHNVTYIPPQVAISPSQAGAICEGLRQRNLPGAAAACASGTAFGSGHPRPDRSHLGGRAVMTRRSMRAARLRWPYC